jgi:hypothetical protein
MSAARYLAEHDGQGFDSYYGVHLRRRGCGKGGDANVAALVGAFADIDCDKHGVGKERALEVVRHAPWGPPSIVVDSGGGIHPLWLYRELLDATETEQLALHRKTQRFIRWWVNDRLGCVAADDMSSRDRILRSPGTHNQKPERRRPDGTQPLASVVEWPTSVLLFECEPILEFQPEDLKWDTVAAQARDRIALDPNDLPTQLPEKLKRVLAAAGLSLRATKRLPEGNIYALVLAHCPACQDNAGDGRCYLTPSGRLKTLHQVHCPAAAQYTHDAGLPLDSWVADYAPQATGALKLPAPGELKRPKPDKVAIALIELGMASDDGAVRKWLTSAGFDGELGDQVIDAGVAHHPESAGRADDRLFRTAAAICGHAEADELLLPLHDVEGHARVVLLVKPDGHQRVLALRSYESLGDLPDGLGILGSLPAAIAAGISGRYVIITETPHDYLAATALTSEGLLDAEVVGVVKPASLGKLTRLLNRAWMWAGALPPNVVMVRGPLPEEEADSATRRLDGRAGVRWFEPQPPTRGRPHLAATIAEYGARATARVLKVARYVVPAPTDIRTASTALRAELEQCVHIAVRRRPDGRLRLVVFVLDAGGGKTHSGTQLAASVAGGQFEIPVNGRRPRSWPDGAEWPPATRRVGYALPNHKLTAEMAGKLRRLTDCDVIELKGALAHCRFKSNVKDVYPAVGRPGICGLEGSDQRCPEAAAGCLGGVEPQVAWGQVAFMAPQLAPNVAMDLCFIDESTGVIEDNQGVDQDMLATLFAPRVASSVRNWRTLRNPDAGEAARLLLLGVAPLANAHATAVANGQVKPFSRFIRRDELIALVRQTSGLEGALARGCHAKAQEPPSPPPESLRAGVVSTSSFPNLRAFRAMQHLQAHFAQLTDDGRAEVLLGDLRPPPPPMMAIELKTDGAWQLVRIARRPLPDCPVVMLDATGEITLDELKTAYPDRDVVVRRMRVQGRAPLIAVHLKTTATRKRWLFDERRGLTQKGAARIRTAVLRAARLALRNTAGGQSGRTTMGILLYKRLHDLMTGACQPQTAHDHRIAALKSELEAMGISLILGYYGKHDRGTNDFEKVDALLFIGDPLPNLGEVELQCEWMGLDAGKVARDRAHATLIQTGFRARHTWRTEADPASLIYVGERAPDMLGVEWEVELLREHRGMAGATKMARAYAAVEFVAQEMGDVLSVRLVQSWEFHDADVGRGALDDVSVDTILDAIRRYAAANKLVEHSVPLGPGKRGRPVLYFGPSKEAILTTVAEYLAFDHGQIAEKPANAGKSGSSVTENDPDSGPPATVQ